MIGTLINVALPFIKPGCQDIPPLKEDPNILKAINRAAKLWGEDYPDVREAREAYSNPAKEGYKDRVLQTQNCCNKCSRYRDKAEEQLIKIDSLIAPLLNSSQAGILGMKEGIKTTFTNPLFLIPIVILIAMILIFAFRR